MGSVGKFHEETMQTIANQQSIYWDTHREYEGKTVRFGVLVLGNVVCI